MLLRSASDFFHLPGCIGFGDCGAEIRCRMHDNVKTHSWMTMSAEFVAEPLIAAWHIGLDAQQIHMPRHRVDLSSEPRNSKGVNDVEAGDGNIYRNARGQVDHTFSFDPVINRIEESAAPLMCHRLNPHRLCRRIAAGVARPRTAHKRPMASG